MLHIRCKRYEVKKFFMAFYSGEHYRPIWKYDETLADNGLFVPLTLDNVDMLFENESITANDVFQKVADKLRTVTRVIFKDLVETPNSNLYNRNLDFAEFSFRELDGNVERGVSVPSGWRLIDRNVNTFSFSGTNIFDRHFDLRAGGLISRLRYAGDNFILSRRLAEFFSMDVLASLPNSPLILLNMPDDYVMVHLDKDAGDQQLDATTDIFVTDSTNLVTGFTLVEVDGVTVTRTPNTRDVIVSIGQDHRIVVRDEKGQSQMAGNVFEVKHGELKKWRDTSKGIRDLKVDKINVFVPELEVNQTELVNSPHLTRDIRSAEFMEVERNRLVDCVHVPREVEFFSYRGNRRSFKPVKASRAIQSLSVLLRNTEDEDLSPWFHTGYTEFTLQLQRNWSQHREERT